MSTEFYWVAVVATTIISAARVTRLATVDKFPPAVWVREKWASLTVDSGWIWLFYCGYCFSFWATLGVILWGLLAGVYDAPANGYDDIAFTAWWIVNGIFAASYLAAVFMAHDGDLNDDEDED